MKRFTETAKWDDPWFRRLPPELKLFWQWILDRCDNAGIIDPDIELASFQIGYEYPMDTLSAFGERVIQIPSGKFFIPKFIAFQYGKLSEDCRAHGPVFQSLTKNGIDPDSFEIKGYPKGMNTLKEKEKVQDKEKDKDKDARARFSKPSPEEVDTYIAAQGYQVNGHAFVDFYESKGWKIGKEPMKDWQAAVRTWHRKAETAAQPSAPKHAGIRQPEILEAGF